MSSHTKTTCLRLFRPVGIIALLCCPWSGCATGSSIGSGTAHTPTSASSVKVYLDPPAQYETIGLVEAQTTSERFMPQMVQRMLVSELKEQAAQLGADGLLIGDSAEHATGNMLQPEKKTLRGRAIRVIKE